MRTKQITEVCPGRRPALIVLSALILGLTLFGLAPAVLSGPCSAPSGKIEPALKGMAESAARSGERVPVIIQFYDDAVADDEAAAIIQGNGSSLKQRYSGLPAASVDLFPAGLEELAQDSRVRHISYDHEVRPNLDTTVRAIGADQLWFNSTGKLHIPGSGVTVAIIDSGIASATDLSMSILSKQIAFGQKTTDDKYGHGTHVAGIITGDGFNSVLNPDYSSKYVGIAPGASVLNLRVLDDKGSGYTSNVLSALDWCIKNKNLYNIRVINLSLGHPVFESYKTDPLCQMVERCVAQGIVVVAAAGNYGKDEYGNALYGGITSPGNDPAVITVGAVNTHNTAARSDDTVATYSSRGPTAIDGLIKPDIVAPGNKIISATNRSVALFKNYPDNRLNLSSGRTSGYYLVLSGTSMAAPAVSGTVAVMLQANPSLTPNAVKAILAYTAERMTYPNILEQGNGYLNAEGAVRLAAAIARDSSNLDSNAQWIADPGAIRPYSVIAGEAILWGDGILWGDSLIWDCRVGSTGLLGASAPAWSGAFIDPSSISISNENILIYGEQGPPLSVRLATSDSMYYPVY